MLNTIVTKYVEDIVEIEGSSFAEVSDKVKEYMEKGYSPIFVKRNERTKGLWVGGAIKRTKVK